MNARYTEIFHNIILTTFTFFKAATCKNIAIDKLLNQIAIPHKLMLNPLIIMLAILHIIKGWKEGQKLFH